MSKGISGLFKDTIGHINAYIDPIYTQPPETTAVVWKHIKSTQEDYNGTILPKSFEIDVPVTKDTPDGKLWTHGNSTEHMYEAISSVNDNPMLKNSNPNLYTQFILYDYYKSVGNAVKNGVNYGKTITYGKWEFIFAKPRNEKNYPVVKHAKFIGL
jgi:hypothetical protein